MSAYGFSTVGSVLPLGVQRAYVPRAAQPHLCWAVPTSPSTLSRALGEHSRLKGDGTAARESAAALEERKRDATSSHGSDRASPSSDVSLSALLTTDGATGTQLALYHDVSSPHVPACSSVIPSQRRVVALWSPPSTTRADGSLADLLSGNVPLYVSDDTGNIFHYRWGDEGCVREPAAKRRRGEEDGGELHDAAAAAAAAAWTTVATAHSAIPSTVAAAGSSPSALEGLFAVSRGAPGWAGLTALNADGDNSATQLVCAREFYHDVRLMDAAQQSVVRVYSTTHAPTGLLSPSVQAAPHCVLVTEGCLATLFDVRCPSAVLSLGEVYTAQAEWTAVRDAAAAEKAQHEQSEKTKEGGAGNGKTATAGAASPAAAPPQPPLIPGRLTSTVGQVRDACCTANPYEVACAVDRALCVYDVRKFNRLFTSSSVLKYVVRGVTPVAGGCGVVCSGIDSEVRLVPLFEKTAEGTALAPLSLAARVVAAPMAKKKQQQQQQQRSEVAAGAEPTPVVFDVETMGPGGTFRTRLNTSVSCTSVWQGGWVTSQNLNGAAAVGISVDGEVFLAQ